MLAKQLTALRQNGSRSGAYWLCGLGVGALLLVFFHYRTFFTQGLPGALLWPGFQWDDHDFLQAVPPLSLTNWLPLFNPHWGWFYRPVFLVYFALLRRLFGDNSAAFHAAGLVLHTGNVLLVSSLVYRLCRSPIPAIACGLALTFDPGPVQAVWFISSASTLLAAAFSLIALHTLLSWQDTRDRRRYGLVLACFALALGSKEDGLSLVFALPIFCLLSPGTRADGRQWLLRSVPFLVILCGYLWADRADFLAWHRYSRIVPIDDYVRIHSKSPADILGHIALNFRFIGGLLQIVRTAPAFMYALSFVGLAGTVGAVALAPGHPSRSPSAANPKALLVLLLWCLTASLPLVMITGVHSTVDRFLYFPTIAICAFLPSAIYQLLRRPNGSEQFVGLAMLAFFAAQMFPVQTVEPFVAALTGLMLGVLTGWLTWRRAVPRDSGALLTAMMIVILPLQVFSSSVAWLVVLAVLGAALTWKDGGWQGLFVAMIPWVEPLLSLPILLALLLLAQSRRQRVQSPHEPILPRPNAVP